MHKKRWLVAVVACAAVAVPVAADAASTSTPAPDGSVGTITPVYKPNKPGAGTVADVTVTTTNPKNVGQLSPPTVATDVYLPAGTVVHPEAFASCSQAQIATSKTGDGTDVCPAGSLVGRGQATVGVVIGGQLVTENATVTAFNGPKGPNHLELRAVGTTPISAQLTVEGTLSTSAAPYGYLLHFIVPPIPSLPGAPNASIMSFQAVVGAIAKGGKAASAAAKKKKKKGKKGKGVAYVSVPKKCPAGGYPWKAVFTFDNGGQATATTTVPCK